MDACNLCGATRGETLESTGTVRVVRCACGLVYVTPQPPRPVLEAAYDEAYYRPWSEQARRREAIWRARLGRLTRHAPPPGRLLDVGCGTGAFLRQARQAGWAVQGTELSPYAAKLATAEGLAVAAGEVWEAGLAAASFDVATCWHVLEHAADPRALVAEVHRILRPGGLFVLATPNLDDRVFQAAYRLVRGRRPPLYEADEREIHLFHFSATSLGRLVTGAGFDVLEVGFDRGAAAVWSKRVVDALALAWFRLTGVHWGLALEAVARKPAAAGEGSPS